MRAFALLMLLALPAEAEGERSGDFDYFVLSLSWSASYCAIEGDASGADQCDTRHDYDFVLHGLWPQFESGWPSYCTGAKADPPRALTAIQADIMGSGSLAWHQWKKHGRCSGLSAEDYYDTARTAFEMVNVPEVLTHLDRDMRLPARVIEEAFTEANPGLSPHAVTITCDQSMIREVRICLTKDLEYRACGLDVARDCRMTDALLPAMR